MRSVLQQAALGLVMSAGTVAVCSVPSDTSAARARLDVPGIATCSVPERAPIDVTARPIDDAPKEASRSATAARSESPALRRLRQVEDAPATRRDYFDERWDEVEPKRPLARSLRPRARLEAASADPVQLSSGLESPDADPSAQAAVRRFVRFFTESREGREGFAAVIERSGRYEEIITQALDDQRLPRTLIAAALVESGFSATAVSPAGAAGLWQFMPGTARAYGLRIERGYDERLSPWRSSKAAAEHLADLYDQLRSWELALAAYNMGYNGLVSRLEANKATTFWELAAIDGGLPAETARYVPRVLAAAIVMANLDAFGFEDVARIAPLAAAEVEVPPGAPIHVLARAAGMPVSAFRELNTELVGNATPRSGAAVLVHVPTQLAERTRATLARLERGEIEPEDLERPREIASWTGRDRRSRARTWGVDRDRTWDRDADLGLERPTPRWRAGADDRDERNARDLRARTRHDEGSPRLPPYARDAYGARDELAEARPRARAPRSETSTVFYRTVEGDTAASVGETFGLPAEDVCTQNGLHAGASLDKGTLLRLRVSAKSLERLESTSPADG